MIERARREANDERSCRWIICRGRVAPPAPHEESDDEFNVANGEILLCQHSSAQQPHNEAMGRDPSDDEEILLKGAVILPSGSFVTGRSRDHRLPEIHCGKRKRQGSQFFLLWNGILRGK